MAEKYVPPGHQPLWKRAMAATEKPKNLKNTLSRLWALTAKQRWPLFAIFCLSGLTSLSAMFSPYFIGKAVDAIGASAPFLYWLLALGILYVGDACVRLSQGVWMATVAQKIVGGIRKQLFEKYNRLPLGFYETRQHGDLMSRITNDIDNISTTISDSLVQLMSLVFTIIGVFIMMAYLNLYLTAAAILTIPMVYILTKHITKRTGPLFRNQQQELGKLNGHTVESIVGIMTLKAFCREKAAIDHFEEINEAFCKTATKAQLWSGLLMPVMHVINNLGFIFVAITGGYLATKGQLSVGVISSFLLYARQFTRPLNDVASIYNTLQSAVAGAERVFEIFDVAEEIDDVPSAIAPTTIRGNIVFKNLSFAYQKEVPVLQDISLAIPAGTRVAIVGTTGAGKTTLISLLSRFYEISEGSILLDSIDIRAYQRSALRKYFSIVLQDAALFQMTIYDNIRYGRWEAEEAEVTRAAQNAGAHSFIKKLPLGYQTLVSSGGEGLSHGEKQLITIARAILQNAPIMILDEATSSVDTRTERKIKDAITALTAGRTSFLIAHRLSTIRDCDVIVVLEHGRILEWGSHQTLMEKQGAYHRMCMLQTEPIQE